MWQIFKSKALAQLRALGYMGLPSFAHSLLYVAKSKESKNATHTSQRDTDYLDGIRGLAAMVLVVSHFLTHSYPGMRFGYGYNGENWSLAQLPVIRIIFSIPTAVNIFFVVSGFVLSANAIQLMRHSSHSTLLQVLSSSTFRRGCRLFIPSVASSTLEFMLLRIGFLSSFTPTEYISSWHNDTLNYAKFLRKLFNVWTLEAETSWFNPPLWTIPFEFRCSMIVYLFLLGLSRSKMRARLAVELMSILYAILLDRWELVLFLWGIFLAELHFHRKELPFDQRVSPKRSILPLSSTPTFLLAFM
jgi:peptidoglycan/LPS O-acetylase OafA/YrhL